MKEKLSEWDKYDNVTRKARWSRFAHYQRQVHNLPEIPNSYYFSVPELAERLAVTKTTIYRYIKVGKILANKAGGEFHINDYEFHKLESKCRKWS